MARPTRTLTRSLALTLVGGGVLAVSLAGCMSGMKLEPVLEAEEGTGAVRALEPASTERETAAGDSVASTSDRRGGAGRVVAKEAPAGPAPAADPAQLPQMMQYDQEEVDEVADSLDDAMVADAPMSSGDAGVGLLGGATSTSGATTSGATTRGARRDLARDANAPAMRAKKAEELRGQRQSRPMPTTVAPNGTATVTTGVAQDKLVQQPVVPESQTEDYTDYGINGFTLTERDRLSTFAVDVDTASYTITRRKLREGYLPPQAAVRVEEFVNYLPYEYAQPKKGHPFAVDVEASPSPYNAQNHIVRVGVQGKQVHFDTRKAVNLTFLVDVSGSMQSRDKMGLVKDTLRMLTEELEDGDTVALVTYAGATKVVLAPTPISQRGRIISALDGLTAGGSTAMGAGIELAYAQAEAAYRPGAVNRVIVASDGDANVGQTSHTELSKFIAGKAQKGITLTTLGFGNGNYKDTMMERLANDGDGNYFYIDSMQESRRIFVDQLSGTLEVIAKDVKIQVEWNPDAVLAYRLIGYENRDVADKDFRNDKVDAGEIGAGHQVTALFEVALRDDIDGGLGTVRIRNKAPGPDSPAVERRYEVPTSVIAGRFGDASPQFRIQTAAAGFAEILRGSPHMNEILLRDVAAIARGAQRVEYNEDAELIELIDRASRLKGEGAVSRR